MKNKINMIKKCAVTGMVAAVATAVMLFAGCLDPFSAPQTEPQWKSPSSPEGMGILTLSIDQGNGRTILPTTVQTQFGGYKLEFVSKNQPPLEVLDTITLYRSGRTLNDDIILPKGIWDLTVIAYLDYDDETDPTNPVVDRPAAKGTLTIDLIANESVDGVVELKAIAEGEGTFSWRITYPNEVEAEMTITPLTAGGTAAQTVPLTGTTITVGTGEAAVVKLVSQASVALKSGSYEVVFKLKELKENGADIERLDILQVYQNLASSFIYEFEERFFNVIKVTGVTLATDAVDTNVDLPLVATVEPSTATFRNIVWSVTATGANGTEAVIKDGVFHATDAEDPSSIATITATIEHGWGYGTPAVIEIPITVKFVGIDDLILEVDYSFDDINDVDIEDGDVVYNGENNRKELRLFDAQTRQLTLTFVPPTATKKNVKWTSSVDTIATVSDTGLVTAMFPGEAVITASTPDNAYKQLLYVNVREVLIDTIELNIDDLFLTRVAPGNTTTLIPLIAPLNATNKRINWTTGVSPTVATLNFNNDNNIDNTCTVTIGSGAAVGQTIRVTAISVAQSTKRAAVDIEIIAPIGGVAVAGVKLNTETLQLVKTATITDTAKLTAIIAPSNVADGSKGLVWKSSDPTVATVLSDGAATGTATVSAVGSGRAIIIVTTESGGFTAQCEVTVRASYGIPTPVTHVTGVSLNTAAITLDKDKTAELIASVLPANATNKKVTWTSSDESAATVDQDGVVTGKKANSTATIMATTEDKGKYAVCTVTVVDGGVKAESVSLNIKTLKLEEDRELNNTERLIGTVLPADTANKNVTWSTSDPDVVEIIDNNGAIKAKAPGDATITVTTEDGGFVDHCTITVREADVGGHGVFGISIAPAASIERWYLTTEQLRVIFNNDLPARIPDNKNLIWYSSDPYYASVDQTGLVTMNQPTTAGNPVIITVISEANGHKATCAVTVLKVNVTHITLNATNTTSSPVNTLYISGSQGTATLLATVHPWNATIQGLKWVSSNTPAVTVPANGDPNDSHRATVKGVNTGTAVITVSSEDPDAENGTITCNVYARTADQILLSGITLNTSILNLELGTGPEVNKTADLIASLAPASANPTVSGLKNVIWYSDDIEVATVVNGKVTAVDVGTANIYATTLNGGHVTLPCVVTVRDTDTTDDRATRLTLSAKELTLSATGTATATVYAFVDPRTAANGNGAANYNVRWSSSDTSVATISQSDTGANTTITRTAGAAAGSTAVITATTVDGGHTAQCTVKVAAISTDVTNLTMSPTQLTLKLGAGGPASGASLWGERQLNATITPGGAVQDVYWYSSNPAIAEVNANGFITAKSAGAASIWATALSSGRSAACTVTVLANDANTVPVHTVTLDEYNLSFKVGRINGSSATGLPDASTPAVTLVPLVEGYRQGIPASAAVSWSSSNTAVVTVSSAGLVTPIIPGTALITVTTTDGAKTAQCDVTVTGVAVSGITISPTSTVTLYIGRVANVPTIPATGGTATLTATVTPANAWNKNITWSSNATTRATVSAASSAITTGNTASITVSSVEGASGTVGNVTITVQATDGSNISGTRSVSVQGVAVTGVTLSGTQAADMTTTAGRAGRTFTATIAPGNAWDKTINWSSTGATFSAASTTATNGTATTNATTTVTVTPALQVAGQTVYGSTASATITATAHNSINGTRTLLLTRSFAQVRIPAGIAMIRGNNPSNVVTSQSVNAFYIGTYQITQDEYVAVMGTNPSHFQGTSYPPITGEVQGRRPVEQVSMYNAWAFCNMLSEKEGLTPVYEIQAASGTTWVTTPGGTSSSTTSWGPVPTNTSNNKWVAMRVVSGATGYRLPTGAEWEYACHGGTEASYNFYYRANGTGANIGTDTSTIDFGWYFTTSNATHQVGLKWPNGYNLYDMHGNIWEWCHAGSNGSNNSSNNYNHTVRGGSFNTLALSSDSSTLTITSTYVRVTEPSSEKFNHPNSYGLGREDYFGLRLARSAP
jgi:uncharacterized protein YjdB/formylglycine-generating enzyme required for sulfatase activity